MPKSNRPPLNRLGFLEEKEVRVRSKKQEKRVAKFTGGSLQRASGATLGRKGDVDSVPVFDIPVGQFKIEAKTTKHRSYSLNLHELNKIEMEAMADGKMGAMVISFEDSYDYLVVRREYVDFGGGAKHGKRKRPFD